MPVFKGSRYEGVRFTGILGKDGKVRKFLHPREPLSLAQVAEQVYIHKFEAGELIDELAWKAAGRPRLWWILADISDVLFPLEIESGSDIVIPTRELLGRAEIG